MRRPVRAWIANPMLWAGLALSVLTIALAFRGIDQSILLSHFASLSWFPLILAIGLLILNLCLRSFRWQVLLKHLAAVPPCEAFAYINIGYLTNDLLPFRLGELVRSALLGKKKGVSKSSILGTVVVERVLDLAMVAVMGLLLILLAPIPLTMKRTIAAFAVVGVILASGLLWITARSMHESRYGESPGGNVLSNHQGILASLVRRWIGLVNSFLAGLVAIRSTIELVAVVFYSVVSWACVLASTWLAMAACGLQLPWTAALAVLVAVNLGATIPSSPSFVGVMHLVVLSVVMLWTSDREQVLSFAIVYHAMFFFVTVGMGVISLGYEGIQFGRLIQAAGRVEETV